MGVLKIYQTPKAYVQQRECLQKFVLQVLGILASACFVEHTSDLLETMFSTLYSNTYRQLVYKRFHPEPVGPQNYS